MSLLEVEDLDVHLATSRGLVHAVRKISFSLEPRRVLGIVGESGSGKSLTALSVIRLLPSSARIGGMVRYRGRRLESLPEAEMCKVRGNAISMIFQEPMTSLNPLHRIGAQITETLLVHTDVTRQEAEKEALRLLERVGIPQARSRFGAFPHQLSGGQRQRVMIAVALSCKPDILIADEPTTALDVTTQKQVLDLLEELIDELGMGMILISHNLAMVGERADDVAVMYGGRIVEQGPTAELFGNLAHPYTRGLFDAMPLLGRPAGQRLKAIPGTVPDLSEMPAGCAFAGRCSQAIDDCRLAQPPVVVLSDTHRAACYAIQAGRS